MMSGLSQGRTRAPVVIVGAGLAGLSAAAHLCAKGIPILILEAQERIGGRVRTTTLPPSPAARDAVTPESVRRVELGATWFHGTVGNAAYNLAISEGLLQPPSDDGNAPKTGDDSSENGGDSVTAVNISDQNNVQEYGNGNDTYNDNDNDHNSNNDDVKDEEDVRIKNPLFAVSAVRMMPDGSAVQTNASDVLPYVAAFRQFTEQLEQEYERRIKKHEDATNESAEKGARESVHEYVWARLEPHPSLLGPTAKAALRAQELFERAVNGCYTTAELDADEYGAYATLEGDNVRAPCGMSSVVSALRDRIPHDAFRLSARVTAVNWQEGKAKHSNNGNNSCTVKVEMDGGSVSVLDATAVVWTCSVNVTKQACDKGVFTPALPPEKVDALARRGQAPVEQVHVVLQHPLCDTPSHSATPILWDSISDDDQEIDDDPFDVETSTTTFNTEESISDGTSNGNATYHRYHHYRDKTETRATTWQHGVFALLYNDESCSVHFWLTGHAAAAFCRTPAADARCQISHLLSTVYRQPVSAAAVVCSNWANNPYIRGGYSYPLLGAQPHDVTCLAQPLPPPPHNPTLFFAGEATHPRFYSTMHGAIESGVREAKRIIKVWEQEF